MPLVATRGAASVQGFGEFAQSAAPVYIEDVMSVFLYEGNGGTQTITNGINLSTNGGLVWMKGRSGATDHALYDTARGATFDLASNTTAAQTTQSTGLTSFGSTGFSIGALAKVNTNAATYASWTFRKQPKFFDIVTYTGNGTARTIAHSLGSVPGCIIVKMTDNTQDWPVYHQSQGNTKVGSLNLTSAFTTGGAAYWNNTTPTSTVFSLGNDISVNQNGRTYVAYLFAHNAGGFGLTGTDNVISCGSYTGNGSSSGPTITLGYEPQWLMIKNATAGGFGWSIYDTMRGLDVGPGARWLQANTINAEVARGLDVGINSTGFQLLDFNNSVNGSGNTYIYIAIRRGPMKTPTSGTSVFSPNAVANDSSAITTNFPVDGYWEAVRTGNPNNFVQQSRLTGGGQYLTTSSTAAENNTGFTTVFQNNTGYTPGTFGSSSLISYAYRRAPGFFDVVCYTGTGIDNNTVAHNLTVKPELIICKYRTGAPSGSDANWHVFSDISASLFVRTYLNTTGSGVAAGYGSAAGLNAAPTASNFYPDSKISVSGATYVAYLFATVAGVSKVGSYSGTGALQTINCGFTSGARFVLIKRTDSTGDWWVYDSARGITSGNDPYLFLNSTAAEVTGTNYVDTDTTGFKVTAAAPAGLNASGGTYIFLAIA